MIVMMMTIMIICEDGICYQRLINPYLRRNHIPLNDYGN